MNRPLFFLCFCLIAMVSRAQQERLPADLRQHNLTTYNASLFNPAFSLDRNNPESVALWARWQWQGIDSNPSTLFLNYTKKLNERSAAGAGFFQHNTGIFFKTGGAVNYAYKFDLNQRVKLSVGANLFGFQQKLADDRFQIDPTLPLPINTDTNDFILQFAPGISLEVERLTLSLTSENLLDYNFGAKEGNTAKDDKIFMSLLSYDLPLNLGSATNVFLRPSMYLRTLPGQSNQVGFYTLLNTDTYWGQVGYNNFYGFAVGGGYTFFDRIMVGAMAEIGTSASLVKESSFELMASYFLGTPDERHKMVGHESDEDALNPLESIEEEQIQEEFEEEAINQYSEQEKIQTEERLEEETKEAEKSKKREAKQRAKDQKAVRDSIAKQKKMAAAALKEQQRDTKREAARKDKEQSDQEKDPQKSRQDKVEEDRAIEKEKAERSEAEAERQKVAREKAEFDAIKADQQRQIDSVAKAKAAAIASKRAQVGEKYEEVTTAAGLLPGYYLIANVFGTKKYYDAFMKDLQSKGMQPKSFVRSINGFSYVYLQRYRTIGEARTARDNQFGGKYDGMTWIFRVTGE